MDRNITRGEYNEFFKRMEEDSENLEKRLEMIEKHRNDLNSEIASVEELLSHLNKMMNEYNLQNERIKNLETKVNTDRKMTRNYLIIGAIIFIIGIAAGYLI